MVATPASASAEILLENPNAPLVIVGQILCIIVPVAVWFAPCSNRSQSMALRLSASWSWRGLRAPWIMRLPGSWDAFCSGLSASSDFQSRSVGLPTTPPGSYSVRCCWV
jgi:hypothetical protein